MASKERVRCIRPVIREVCRKCYKLFALMFIDVISNILYYLPVSVHKAYVRNFSFGSRSSDSSGIIFVASGITAFIGALIMEKYINGKLSEASEEKASSFEHRTIYYGSSQR